jgi:hypothetical protein
MNEPDPVFPNEREWLDLPLPPELEPAGGSAAFVDRTVDALRADRELDAAIAAEDAALPRILLTAHTTPAANADFVASTMAALHRERRQRWQQLLARHVAPEPTPDFVARTLQALAADGVGPARSVLAPRARSASPLRPAQAAKALPWLVAAAATAVFFLLRDRPDPAPFESRLARSSPTAWAHTGAGQPLAVLLAAQEHRRDPAALAMAEPDGLWLAFGGTR